MKPLVFPHHLVSPNGARAAPSIKRSVISAVDIGQDIRCIGNRNALRLGGGRSIWSVPTEKVAIMRMEAGRASISSFRQGSMGVKRVPSNALAFSAIPAVLNDPVFDVEAGRKDPIETAFHLGRKVADDEILALAIVVMSLCLNLEKFKL